MRCTWRGSERASERARVHSRGEMGRRRRRRERRGGLTLPEGEAPTASTGVAESRLSAWRVLANGGKLVRGEREGRRRVDGTRWEWNAGAGSGERGWSLRGSGFRAQRALTAMSVRVPSVEVERQGRANQRQLACSLASPAPSLPGPPTLSARLYSLRHHSNRHTPHTHPHPRPDPPAPRCPPPAALPLGASPPSSPSPRSSAPSPAHRRNSNSTTREFSRTPPRTAL